MNKIRFAFGAATCAGFFFVLTAATIFGLISTRHHKSGNLIRFMYGGGRC